MLNREVRKRCEKIQGSAKLNVACTSQIILTKKESGELVAEYHEQHYGHNCDIKHLNLSNKCRQEVASKLILLVTPQQ